MAKHSKRFESIKAKLKDDEFYELEDALRFIKENASTKFDETVEVAMRLGVDPRHADQMVRGTLVLPHGTGSKVRVLVFATGEKELEAKNAGADFVGCDEYIEKINGGWLEFDAAVATPDLMGKVGRLGRMLGPRGLMPNPKAGTVTFDLARAIRDIKAGKIEFRVDKGANIHAPIGKASFELDQLRDNTVALFDAIIKAKPSSSKGVYLKSVVLSSTMGAGLKLDTTKVTGMFRA
ncbi:50S ribosomal protein L1 [bacterium]|nr:50S ribosomal protein L1 [candidate division CSSED10-310 bacterium]